MNQPLHIVHFEIKGETWTTGYSCGGLARIWFPGQFQEAAIRSVKSQPVKVLISQQTKTQNWLNNYLNGKNLAKSPMPLLDITSGTPFQQQVWQALLKIPYGHTQSYGEIATFINNPKAVRATGGACGANPIPLIIPCHRVLAANRKLGGFSGGLPWKKRLLALENIEL